MLGGGGPSDFYLKQHLAARPVSHPKCHLVDSGGPSPIISG